MLRLLRLPCGIKYRMSANQGGHSANTERLVVRFCERHSAACHPCFVAANDFLEPTRRGWWAVEHPLPMFLESRFLGPALNAWRSLRHFNDCWRRLPPGFAAFPRVHQLPVLLVVTCPPPSFSDRRPVLPAGCFPVRSLYAGWKSKLFPPFRFGSFVLRWRKCLQ